MGEKYLLTKPIKFGVNEKRILCWSIFAIKPIADFCLFWGYWPSKNAPGGHGIKGEFVSLAKPIILCTIGKRILCWSIFATELLADFCPFWDYWPSKNWPRDHDVKGEFASLAKPFVFGTTEKRILCSSIIAVESIADFSLFVGYWPSKNGSHDYDVKGEFVSLAKPILFGTAGKKNVLVVG